MIEEQLPCHSWSASPSSEILERNLSALERANPDVRSRFESCDQKDVLIETAVDGLPTGTLDGRRLASRHAPGEEADRLLNDLDFREFATACVLGFGLGHHVERIVRSLLVRDSGQSNFLKRAGYLSHDRNVEHLLINGN